MFFSKARTNVTRGTEIAIVLIKYGFEQFVQRFVPTRFIPRRKKLLPGIDESHLNLTVNERIRMAIEELGPTFIKIAQIISSNRPEAISDSLLQEFEKLQSNVPPFNFETARQIIEEELGKSIDELFDDFIEIPLASASIGQVHRARLKNGDEVIVKVQRPGIKDTVEKDISLLKEIIRIGEKQLNRVIPYPKDFLKEIERSMRQELDYTHEARSIETFRNYYKNRKDFYVPKAYRDFSTNKVMVVEFAKGCKITDVRQLEKWGHDPRDIANIGLDLYLMQVFEHGYFHADPHPGNVLVREDGVICLIDFGLVGKMPQRDKFAFANIFVAMARSDARSMALSLKKLSVDDQIEDIRMLEYDLEEIIQDFADLDLKESSIADLTQRLLVIFRRYVLRMPSSVALVFRALTILEGMGKLLHPEMNTFEHIKPYGRKIITQQLSYKVLFDEAFHRYQSYATLLTALPYDLRAILKKARSGKLRLEIDHFGYEPLLRKMERVTNRISLTLIITSLIIGSAIFAMAPSVQELPTITGIPVVSFIGLIGAAALLIILFFHSFGGGRD